MNFKFLFPLIFTAICAGAEEPGHLVNETPPPEPQLVEDLLKAPANVRETPAVLAAEFKNARGLSSFEAQTLELQRISCDRRIFTGTGRTVDGDGDLKVTRVTSDLFEAEFPSYIYLANYNPFGNGIAELESVDSRRLVNFRGWSEGQSLRLYKNVTVSYVDQKKLPQIVEAVDEFRVVPDSYPAHFIVRETVFSNPKITLYYICVN